VQNRSTSSRFPGPGYWTWGATTRPGSWRLGPTRKPSLRLGVTARRSSNSRSRRVAGRAREGCNQTPPRPRSWTSRRKGPRTDTDTPTRNTCSGARPVHRPGVFHFGVPQLIPQLFDVQVRLPPDSPEHYTLHAPRVAGSLLCKAVNNALAKGSVPVPAGIGAGDHWAAIVAVLERLPRTTRAAAGHWTQLVSRHCRRGRGATKRGASMISSGPQQLGDVTYVEE
jgi:hypothetical protein